MTFKQLTEKLKRVSELGYVVTLRKGPTGIGYTLEKLLEIVENNLSIPDIGGRVELKATRKNVGTLITLFTLDKSVWKVHPKDFIEKYGYTDDQGRKSYYNMAKVGEVNSQGLTLSIDYKNNEVLLIHRSSNAIIAKWSVFAIIGKFLNKTERVILVTANSRYNINNREEFHYSEAYLLENPKPNNFLDVFKEGKIVIDVRMHLKPNSAVRNHGTGMRINENDLLFLYSKRRNLI